MAKFRLNGRFWLAGVLGCALWTGCIVEDISDEGALAAKVERSRAPLLGAEAADAIPDQYIVRFREGISAAALDAASNRIALAGDVSQVMHRYTVIPGFAARLSPAALEEVRRNPDVEYVERDQIITPRAIYPAPSRGNDQTDQCSGTNGLYDDHDRPGSFVNVYVIDTGIRTTHTEFTGRVGPGFTVINDGNGVQDCQGHGTHVASLAVGTQYGMAKQARVHPVRVMNCQGSGTTSGVIAGVDFVRTDCPSRRGPCVANMSIGGALSASLNSAVQNAIASGVTVVAASGSGDACNSSPGSVPQVITVTASNDAGCPAPFAGYGSCLDLYAPGVGILGAYHNHDSATATLSGSSMAAGLTSGAAAMYLGANPAATPAQVAAAIVGAAVQSCNCTIPRLYNDLDNPITCPGCESCEGRCGTYDAAEPCQCDDDCVQFDDCCVDKDLVCP